MSDQDLQFYPTPPALVSKMWAQFKNRSFSRVLDPSAGTGDLLLGAPHLKDRYHRSCQLDAIEIDPGKHPTLREKGIDVVGLDFMEFSSGSLYSHILQNPPFAQGCQHVLKAWETMFNGEIVAIINAQTLRNPFSKERQLLAALIERHGNVEYIEGAFTGADVAREADVEIALIHLTKQADACAIVGDVLSQLQDDRQREQLGHDVRAQHQIALPKGFVEDLVLTFDAAVQSMRDSVKAEARASYYEGLLGLTLSERDESNPEEGRRMSSGVEFVRKSMSERYDVLKARAWSHVLRSTEVTSRLSSSAQKRLENEFESIKKLEISEPNIYGFLAGLSGSAGEIQMGMVCDVFDLITRYHSDNAVFYMGWKSNDRHRTCGKRVKMTRFVIPGHTSESYMNGLRYESMSMLADMDKVFAMLDGKRLPQFGLVDLFRTDFHALRTGARLSSDYFDVRYYPGVGTIHFFARDKALIDRFNRVVGRRRNWLPPDVGSASAGFWQQYEQAERIDPEIRREFARASAESGLSAWSRPRIEDAMNDSSERGSAAAQILFSAAQTIMLRRGIDVDGVISGPRAGSSPLLLEVAQEAQAA